MPVMSDVFGLLLSAVGKLFSVVVVGLEVDDVCFYCSCMLLLLSLDSAACGLE